MCERIVIMKPLFNGGLMYPTIKPYKEIVITAAKLFGMTETEAEIELDRRLRFLGISKEAVVVYVNYADHNTLTINQLARTMNRNISTIKSHLRTIRQEWPELFILAAYRDAAMAAVRCPSVVNGFASKWKAIEEVKNGQKK